METSKEDEILHIGRHEISRLMPWLGKSGPLTHGMGTFNLLDQKIFKFLDSFPPGEPAKMPHSSLLKANSPSVWDNQRTPLCGTKHTFLRIHQAIIRLKSQHRIFQGLPGLIILESNHKEAVEPNQEVPAGARKVWMGMNSEGSG